MTDPRPAEALALDLLRESTLQVVGALREASNVTVLADLLDAQGRPTGRRAVYKPVRGERPLRDFPTGTLAAREVAAYVVSELGGWRVVPPTVLRDGPLGEGSVQLWVEGDHLRPAGTALVDIVTPEEAAQDGWLGVVEVRDEDDQPLVVVHRDDPALRAVALLDAVLDNADRKAAHLGLTAEDGDERVWAFDHGLCLNAAPKLRTVLWGWAGQPLTDEESSQVARVRDALGRGESGLEDLLDEVELDVLVERVDGLLAEPKMPLPPVDRYPLPWPLW